MTPGLDSAIAVIAGAVASAIGLWANYKWGPAAKERKAIRERDREEGRDNRHDRDAPDETPEGK
jgi:hypothetical protein